MIKLVLSVLLLGPQRFQLQIGRVGIDGLHVIGRLRCIKSDESLASQLVLMIYLSLKNIIFELAFDYLLYESFFLNLHYSSTILHQELSVPLL